MAAATECSHSVLAEINQLATLLASIEGATDVSTAATAVAKYRSAIYVALFRRGTMPTERMLELLSETSRELRKDPQRRARLHSFQSLLEEQGEEKPRVSQVSQAIEKKVENSPQAVHRVLRPGVLKLYEVQPMKCSIFTEPVIFKSIKQLKLDLKPLQLKAPIGIPLPSNMNKSTGQIISTTVATTTSCVAASLNRIRESRQQSMPPIPQLEFLSEREEEKEEPQKYQEPGEEKEEPQKYQEPGSPKKKHFISDLMMSNELYLHSNKELVLSYIKEALLIDHLKKAAAGIQSETFRCSPEDDMELLIRPNTTLRTVLPETLANFSEHFLRAGSAYRRLSARITLSSYNTARLERPLNRVLREILMDYLVTSRQFLLIQPADTLPQLLINCQTVMQLLQQLENVFEREPRLNLEAGVPGCFLMNCLWQAIATCGYYDFLQFVIYLLRRISETYFGQLQTWIYHGEVDEELNDIFITRCRSAIDECSKEFFNSGYQVVNEEIPAILAGCEQNILQCGMYHRVLKAYNAQHPVFDVEFPAIEVCLTMQQLRDMRRRMVEKYTIIYQRFGSCSLQSIFEERMAAKRNLQNIMVEQTRAHVAAWEENRRVLQLEANAKKKLLYDQLKAELELHQQEVREKRRQESGNEGELLEEKRQLQETEKETLLKQVAQLQDLSGVEPQSQDTFNPESRPESVIDKDDKPEEAETEAVAGTDNSEQPDKAIFQPTSHRRPLDKLTSNDNPLQSLQSDFDRNRKQNLSSKHFQELVVNVKESADPTTSILKETKTGDQLTDVQRYRLRMQQHFSFGDYNSTEDQDQDNTQRGIQRQVQSTGRRKIMSSEYGNRLGIHRADCYLHLPLETNKLDVEVPMSITSDADIGALKPPEQHNTTDKDAANNNNNINNNNNNNDDKVEDTVASPGQAVEQILTSFRPTFRLPTNFQAESKPMATPTFTIPEPCDPLMTRQCLQQSLMVPVNAHYTLLRNEVLRMFKELRIDEHFRRLRNYFFLLDGQFGGLLITQILDRIQADPKSLAQRGVPNTMLGNALACCPADETRVTQNLTLNCTKIMDRLNIWSPDATAMLSLHCKVDWPLNLVISSETIDKYSEIFRYLLKLRHVSYILDGTLQHLQRMGKLLGSKLRTSVQFLHLQVTRHKLLHFVTSLQTHLEAKALRITWKSFKEDLCRANSIEDLDKHHVSYLKRVAFFAFLNPRVAMVKEIIDNMLVTALRFCKVIQSQTFKLDGENRYVHRRFKRLLQEEAEFEKLMHDFINLGNMAAATGYQEEIGDLICLINFNNYY